MKTQMHRFRKKALAITTIAACSLFFVASCQKHEDLNPTPEELDTINAHSIDYALQVIPDIHEVIPMDLIEAMNAVHDTINGTPTVVCALHFGDNPPNLYKIINDTILGFITEGFKYDSTIYPDTIIYKYRFFQVKKYIPCGSPIPTLEEGKFFLRPFSFLVHDQHRGIAQLDLKDDKGYAQSIEVYDISHLTDSVFIMGEGNLFTLFCKLNPELHTNISTVQDYKQHIALILSGEVTDNGIKNLYYGYKLLGYGETPPDFMQEILANVNDIVILSPSINLVPFRYWDPNN